MGVNIVPFFAYTHLLMAPAYRRAREAGAEPHAAARVAYDLGLVACVLTALLELLGRPGRSTLRLTFTPAAHACSQGSVDTRLLPMQRRIARQRGHAVE